MVGHMLGLGDRHPSNLMLSKHTGKILHIDFGDCFEVAMRREKFPETIPFRLTRMVINAMEVSAQWQNLNVAPRLSAPAVVGERGRGDVPLDLRTCDGRVATAPRLVDGDARGFHSRPINKMAVTPPRVSGEPLSELTESVVRRGRGSITTKIYLPC